MSTEQKKWNDDEIDAKVKELSSKLGCNIYPLVFPIEDETIVGFLKEPARIVKMRALDQSMQSAMSAGETILASCIIAEESDKRITSESSEYDKIFMGACLTAVSLISVQVNAYKKK